MPEPEKTKIEKRKLCDSMVEEDEGRQPAAQRSPSADWRAILGPPMWVDTRNKKSVLRQ